MERHETPKQVARTLAKHAPRSLSYVLDPSVGNGALLRPLAKKLTNNQCKVVAIDNDPLPLENFVQEFALLGSHVTTICEDFLSWSIRYSAERHKSFDCVVMNPPFCAQPKQWISYNSINRLYPSDSFPVKGPIEAGFVIMAIHLLKRHGRLLAVLPASLITTPSYHWLRLWMRKMGAIRKVHELPPFAFPNIGGRIYLVIFEKGISCSDVALLNHDLHTPEKLTVNLENLSERLDFRYHQASSMLQRITAYKALGWKTLGQVAAIIRGDQASPKQSSSVIHTTNYRNGMWCKPKCPFGSLSSFGLRLLSNDLLVKRVSRDCSSTFGLATDAAGLTCSDCILIIRPLEDVCHLKLIFSLRCFFTSKYAKQKIERGTGASYITQSDLSETLIPSDVHKLFPVHFSNYRKAISANDFFSMTAIESDVQLQIARRLDGKMSV